MWWCKLVDELGMWLAVATEGDVKVFKVGFS